MCAFTAVRTLQQNHLRWGAVSTVFANPLGIVDFGTIEDGDVVVAAVVVSFHVELLKLHFNNLEEARNRKGKRRREQHGDVSEP